MRFSDNLCKQVKGINEIRDFSPQAHNAGYYSTGETRSNHHLYASLQAQFTNTIENPGTYQNRFILPTVTGAFYAKAVYL